MQGQNGQNGHPLDAETSETLLSGLEGQGGADLRPVEDKQQVVSINRERSKRKAPKTKTVEQPPIQHQTSDQQYYSEQQMAEQQTRFYSEPQMAEQQTQFYSEQPMADGRDQQHPTTYKQTEELSDWDEPIPRRSLTISRWRLQLLEGVATVSGSTLIFSVVSLSPLGAFFLSLSPQVVLASMGTAILCIGFLGEISLPANLTRIARKSTTVMLGVVLGYVFWWGIVSRTPVIAPAPNAPFITQPLQKN